MLTKKNYKKSKKIVLSDNIPTWKLAGVLLFVVIVIGFLVWYPTLGKKGVAGQAISQGEADSVVKILKQKSPCGDADLDASKKVLCYNEEFIYGPFPIIGVVWVDTENILGPPLIVPSTKSKDNIGNSIAKAGHFIFSTALTDTKANYGFINLSSDALLCDKGVVRVLVQTSQQTSSIPEISGVKGKSPFFDLQTILGSTNMGMLFAMSDGDVFVIYNGLIPLNNFYKCTSEGWEDVRCKGKEGVLMGKQLCTGEKPYTCDSTTKGLIKNVGNKFDAVCVQQDPTAQKDTASYPEYVWAECDVGKEGGSYDDKELDLTLGSYARFNDNKGTIAEKQGSHTYLCGKTEDVNGPAQADYKGWETWFVCPANKIISGSDGVGVTVGEVKKGRGIFPHLCTSSGWVELACTSEKPAQGNVLCTEFGKKDPLLPSVSTALKQVVCTENNAGEVGIVSLDKGKLEMYVCTTTLKWVKYSELCKDNAEEGSTMIISTTGSSLLCAQGEAKFCGGGAGNAGLVRDVSGKFDAVCDGNFWYECNSDTIAEGKGKGIIPVLSGAKLSVKGTNTFYCGAFSGGYESWYICPTTGSGLPVTGSKGVTWASPGGYKCDLKSGWQVVKQLAVPGEGSTVKKKR